MSTLFQHSEVLVLIFAMLGIPLANKEMKIGHKPPMERKRIPAEVFHLQAAKDAYVNDDLTLEEYEKAVEHVLKGGILDSLAHPMPKIIVRTVSYLDS